MANADQATGSVAAADSDQSTEDSQAPEQPVDPRAPLPTLVTSLTKDEIRARLGEANYRGRLPEMVWDKEDDRHFTFDILGHRLEHDVFATIEERDDQRQISFEVQVKRQFIKLFVGVLIISTLLGPPFMDMVPLLNRIPYPWVWFPPLNMGLGLWWLLAEVRKTIPVGWTEAVKYTDKLAKELDGQVVPADS
jgi:hypothetical protein